MSEKSKIAILSDEEMSVFQKYNEDLDRIEEAGEEHFEKNQWRKAFTCYRILTKCLPDIPSSWVKCGFFLYKIDETNWGKTRIPQFDNALEAVKYLDKALKLDNNDYWAWFWKGMCYGNIGSIKKDKNMIKKGIDCFKKSQKIRPNETRPALNIQQFEMILKSI